MASFGCGAWVQDLLSKAPQQPVVPIAAIAANAPAKIEEARPADVDLALVGPGWYQSSRELMQGLVVREGMPSDITLHEWLAAELPGASRSRELCEAMA